MVSRLRAFTRDTALWVGIDQQNFFSALANLIPKLTVVVVLPTPPFWLAMAMISGFKEKSSFYKFNCHINTASDDLMQFSVPSIGASGRITRKILLLLRKGTVNVVR